MPNSRVQRLVDQIHQLEEELQQEIHKYQEQTFYRLKGKKIEFEATVKASHKRLKIGLFRWLLQSQVHNVLSAPFIYGLVIPMMFLDLSLFFYQLICFRLYGINKVKRSDYIVIDHQHLKYLNLMEKINCVYCSYGNGLFSYAREIGSLTEQYWCPIKHARKVTGSHDRYTKFLDYGDADGYRNRYKDLRDEVIATDRQQ